MNDPREKPLNDAVRALGVDDRLEWDTRAFLARYDALMQLAIEEHGTGRIVGVTTVADLTHHRHATPEDEARLVQLKAGYAGHLIDVSRLLRIIAEREAEIARLRQECEPSAEDWIAPSGVIAAAEARGRAQGIEEAIQVIVDYGHISHHTQVTPTDSLLDRIKVLLSQSPDPASVILAGGSAQWLFDMKAPEHGFSVENLSDGPLWIGLGKKPASEQSMRISPHCERSIDLHGYSTVSIFGLTTGQKFVARSW